MRIKSFVMVFLAAAAASLAAMPTKQELSDLNSKCSWYWTTMNGVKGWLVSGTGNCASNSIFLPCAGIGKLTSLNHAGMAGYYWSSVLEDGSINNCAAWGLYIYSSGRDMPPFLPAHDYNCREFGHSVRPVQGVTK